MKKKIGLVLLLIAVVAGMAFAQVGRSIKFQVNGSNKDPMGKYSEVLKIISVIETKNGIQINYTNTTNSLIKKAVIYTRAYHTDPKSGKAFLLDPGEESYNTELAIRAGKSYSPTVKYKNPSSITIMDIFVDTGKPKKDDTDLYDPPYDPPKAPKEKKDWIDRLFPPLKL